MTAKARATLNSDADTNLADNTAGDISALDVRTIIKDLADSAYIATDDGAPLTNAAAFATAAQGATADAALPKSGGTMTGNILMSAAETVDGRDLSVDGAKLDGIESGAQANTVGSVNSKTGTVVINPDDLDDTATTHKFTTAGDISKLAGIESGATADQTASEILTAIKTVDGALSGLDADLLDGNEATAFASAAQGALAASALQNIVEDTTPQLGGNLDLNGHTITGLVIGTDVQAHDADLDTIAGLTATTDNFIQAKSNAWASRTPAQVTADLIAVVGDSGSGGTKGLVPAPGAGDAAAGKFLKADGTWATAGGGATLVSNQQPTSNVTSVEATGLSSYRTVRVLLAFTNLSAASPVTYSFQARTSGGTWRTLLSNNSLSGDSTSSIFMTINIMNFNQASEKLFWGATVTGTNVLDDSSASNDGNVNFPYNRLSYNSYSEVWDEVRILSDQASSIGGATADQRGRMMVYGEAA